MVIYEIISGGVALEESSTTSPGDESLTVAGDGAFLYLCVYFTRRWRVVHLKDFGTFNI